MAKEKQSVKERKSTKLSEPKKYKVIMHNDDVTTMDFVVMVLKSIFFKSEQEAETLMMQIHTSGSAIVGIYPFDTAVSKASKTMRLASINKFPLKLTWEQE